VFSGVPQGSILGPLLFIIFINDIVECCSSCNIFLYADDSKIFKHILTQYDSVLLQNDLDTIKTWLDRWLVSLNVSKCKAVGYSYHSLSANKYYFTHKGEQIEIEGVNTMKDLGVIFDSCLKFDQHIHEKINKAYGILGLIKRNFKDLSTRAFIHLYKAIVRPHLEYANVVWSPHHIMYIEELEKVQMRATKIIKQLNKCSYENRLRQLDLPTLRYRRIRGDMIEVYKLVHGLYDSSSCINLEFSRNVNTRGNRFKLAKNQFHYDARKYYFVNRIVSIWNSLPDEIVSLTSLDSFKYHLDKFWSSQDIKYDWRANMAGTGAVSFNL
jgi:ribonuclease P/MRP protein subunit RPP40